MTWTGATRKIAGKLEIQFDGTNWSNETAFMLNAQGSTATIQPVWVTTGAINVSPAQLTLTMMGADGRYSPFATGGTFYAYLATTHGYGIPLRFSVGYDDAGLGVYTYEYVFTGRIDSIMTTNATANQVTIRATDNSAWLQQYRMSTTLDQQLDAGAYIAKIATAAGITDTDLDPGLALIPNLWLDDEAVYNEICLLAQAESGYAMFDRTGTLVFENAETWAEKTSQHTFTVSSFRQLAFTSSWQNIYSRIVVVYADRALVAADEIFSLRQAQVILPGDSVTITAQHKPVYGTITYAITVTDYSGVDMTSDVTVTTTPYAQRTVVTFANGDTTKAAVVSTFTLTAMTLSGDDDHDVSRDVTGSPLTETKTLRIAGNPYLQTEFQAAQLADMLRDRLALPRAVFTVTAPGIPTLEPGTMVTITEGESGVSRTCFITSITYGYANGTYGATYQAIDAGDWFPETTYFKLASSTLGGSAVLFY